MLEHSLQYIYYTLSQALIYYYSYEENGLHFGPLKTTKCYEFSFIIPGTWKSTTTTTTKPFIPMTTSWRKNPIIMFVIAWHWKLNNGRMVMKATFIEKYEHSRHISSKFNEIYLCNSIYETDTYNIIYSFAFVNIYSSLIVFFSSLIRILHFLGYAPMKQHQMALILSFFWPPTADKWNDSQNFYKVSGIWETKPMDFLKYNKTMKIERMLTSIHEWSAWNLTIRLLQITFGFSYEWCWLLMLLLLLAVIWTRDTGAAAFESPLFILVRLLCSVPHILLYQMLSYWNPNKLFTIFFAPKKTERKMISFHFHSGSYWFNSIKKSLTQIHIQIVRVLHGREALV